MAKVKEDEFGLEGLAKNKSQYAKEKIDVAAIRADLAQKMQAKTTQIAAFKPEGATNAIEDKHQASVKSTLLSAMQYDQNLALYDVELNMLLEMQKIVEEEAKARMAIKMPPPPKQVALPKPDNAFARFAEDYSYKFEDIQRVMPIIARQHVVDREKVAIAAPLGGDNRVVHRELVSLIPDLKAGKIVVGVFDKGGHWQVYSVVYKQEKYYTYLKDSVQPDLTVLVARLKAEYSDAFISISGGVEQKGNAACGIYAMHNAMLMAKMDIDDIVSGKKVVFFNPNPTLMAERKLYGKIYGLAAMAEYFETMFFRGLTNRHELETKALADFYGESIRIEARSVKEAFSYEYVVRDFTEEQKAKLEEDFADVKEEEEKLVLLPSSMKEVDVRADAKVVPNCCSSNVVKTEIGKKLRPAIDECKGKQISISKFELEKLLFAGLDYSRADLYHAAMKAIGLDHSEALAELVRIFCHKSFPVPAITGDQYYETMMLAGISSSEAALELSWLE